MFPPESELPVGRFRKDGMAWNSLFNNLYSD